MPEGPEVKTVARTLAPRLIGKQLGRFWHSPHQLRRAVDYQRIQQHENGVIDQVECYGKILFIHVDKKPALLAQLGMTGQLTVVPISQALVPHTHIRWPLKNTELELRYVDPRRFGLFDACNADERLQVISRLGPDPFHMKGDDGTIFARAVKKSARSIKEILLDQSVVVGVGNIYASEALFHARINPLRQGMALSNADCKRLMEAVVNVLHLAFTNCGTSFSNYVDGTGKKGENLSYLSVFQKQGLPCPLCTTPIERIKQSGRSTFFCPNCQTI